jgi:hypothetical protein
VPEIHATFVEADQLLRAAVERTIQIGDPRGRRPADMDAKAFAGVRSWRSCAAR